MRKFCVSTDQYVRADKILSALFEGIYSRAQIQKGFTLDQIKVWQSDKNTFKVRAEKYFLKKWDIVTIDIVPISSTLPPDYRPLDIVFENSDFVIVNKDAGINTHPTPGWNGREGTLVNQLIAHIKDFDREEWEDRPGIVHRLDKNTSGLIIVAKNDPAMRNLQRLIHDHKVEKTYLALVHGELRQQQGTITSLIGRDPNNRIKMTVKNPIEWREAVTHFSVTRTFSYRGRSFSLLSIILETGRTHQIRVHLSHIGHTIVGDEVYGNISDITWTKKHLSLERQFLHAQKLHFSFKDEDYSFEAPLKADLQKTLKILDA